MVAAVVVAAGQSTRMGGGDKNLLNLAGKPALRWTLEALEDSADIDGIWLVTAADRLERYRVLGREWGLSKLRAVVEGGATRTQSVLRGLRALPGDCEIVAVQDAARPCLTGAIIAASVASARERGSGVAAIACQDTVKVAEPDGRVLATPDRSALRLIQTPQSFRLRELLAAYEQLENGQSATDDAGIMEQAGHPVFLTPGSPENRKLTTPEDVALCEDILRRRRPAAPMLRVGEGYDAHRLVAGRKLILGGVEVPHSLGLLGHSDADVLTHAVMDALLGAASLGDIGQHFPDSDERYRGADSLELLRRVAGLLAAQGWSVGNVDATIVAQRPKLMPHLPAMAINIAAALGVECAAVSVKATTTERMGPEGREEGVSARAVCLIRR